MQLKRGWWKQKNGEYAFLAGEHGHSWFGRNSKETATAWLSDSGRSWYSSDHEEHGCGFDDLTDTYCGHGLEPVEPVAQPDPRDAEIERLKGEVTRLTGFKQAYLVWQDKTEWIQNKKDLPAKYLGWHRADIMKDMIERLTADNANLKNDLENIKRIIGDH